MSILRRSFSGSDGFSWGAFFWNAFGAAVLAVLLARWVWIWFAPSAPSVLPVAESASPADAERLFGVSAVVTDKAAPPANLALTGVFTGRNGFAVFELDGKRQISVAIGGEISPGMKLLEASSDHVIVGGNGVQQRVDLRSATPKH